MESYCADTACAYPDFFGRSPGMSRDMGRGMYWAQRSTTIPIVDLGSRAPTQCNPCAPHRSDAIRCDFGQIHSSAI